MTALDSQMLPSIAGAAELMTELSPHGLALNLECLQRLARSLAQAMLARGFR